MGIFSQLFLGKKRELQAQAKQYEQDKQRLKEAEPMEVHCYCGGKAIAMIAPDRTIMGAVRCTSCHCSL